jgi:hypothetical protein
MEGRPGVGVSDDAIPGDGITAHPVDTVRVAVLWSEVVVQRVIPVEFAE